MKIIHYDYEEEAGHHTLGLSDFEAEGAICEVIFSNNPKTILDYTKSVLTCDIHSRFRTKRILTTNGAEKVFGLDDILIS